MSKKKKKILGMEPFQAIMLLGIVVLGGFALVNSGMVDQFVGQQITTPDAPGENFFEVDATITFTVADLLSGAAVSGDLQIYDPNDLGVLLDTITVTTGTGTSSQLFHTGRILGIQFNGTASYYAYSWEISVPYATSNELAAVTYPTVLKTLGLADYTADTDFDIESSASATIWDGSTVQVDLFKPDTDDDPILTIDFSQEDGNTGYGYPTIWKDYSTTTPGLAMRGAYAVVEFALNATGDGASGLTMTNVNDYLKFEDLGGCTKYTWGTSVFLIKQMNSEYLCGYNDDDSEGNTENGLTGSGIFLQIQFDFDGAISGTGWSDEISVQFSFMANWAIDFSTGQETLSQTGDTPLGWEGSHYTTDTRLTMG